LAEQKRTGFYRNSNLREGPYNQGASWVVCGSGVPPYDSLNLYGILNSRFFVSFSEKRLELKSLKR
jgi:hypothetical protein